VTIARGFTPPPRCWQTIGVTGDRSCPELSAVIHCRNCGVFARAAAELLEQAPPPGYAAFWAENVALEAAPVEASTSVVLFRLGREWLALDTAVLREVAGLRSVHPIPHRAHTLLEGLVNIRGELHLCLALDRLLEIPRDRRGPTARMIVLEHRSETWVFRADEVFGVERLPTSSLGGSPATLPAPLAAVTRGIFPWREVHAGYLRGDALFATFARALA
jgi:chemotaxis-related protein WspD